MDAQKSAHRGVSGHVSVLHALLQGRANQAQTCRRCVMLTGRELSGDTKACERLPWGASQFKVTSLTGRSVSPALLREGSKEPSRAAWLMDKQVRPPPRHSVHLTKSISIGSDRYGKAMKGNVP